MLCSHGRIMLSRLLSQDAKPKRDVLQATRQNHRLETLVEIHVEHDTLQACQWHVIEVLIEAIPNVIFCRPRQCHVVKTSSRRRIRHTWHTRYLSIQAFENNTSRIRKISYNWCIKLKPTILSKLLTEYLLTHSLRNSMLCMSHGNVTLSMLWLRTAKRDTLQASSAESIKAQLEY